jgi:hypothetical protein
MEKVFSMVLISAFINSGTKKIYRKHKKNRYLEDIKFIQISISLV